MRWEYAGVRQDERRRLLSGAGVVACPIRIRLNLLSAVRRASQPQGHVRDEQTRVEAFERHQRVVAAAGLARVKAAIKAYQDLTGPDDRAKWH